MAENGNFQPQKSVTEIAALKNSAKFIKSYIKRLQRNKKDSIIGNIRLNDTSVRPKTFVAINVTTTCKICSKLAREARSFMLYFEQILLVNVVVS